MVQPIEEAIVAAQGDLEKTKELETQLAAILGSDAPYGAKQYVCRRLCAIGTAASVPALAALLSDEKLSHMARYALEAMPAAEAGQALRDALPNVADSLKVGVITSLGVRGEDAAAQALAAYLNNTNGELAVAAARALGAIGSPAAKAALEDAKPTDATAIPVADAKLACAENLVAAGDKAAAMAVYKSLLTSPVQHVKLAATRGMLVCAQK